MGTLMPMSVGMMRRFAVGAAAALALLAPSSAGAATTFTLIGHGWGHGIGMSQYGALGYAQHGWGYKPILRHYFTGTRIAPLAGAVTERVLLSEGPAVHFGADSGMRAVDAVGHATALAAGSYRIQPGGAGGRVQIVSGATGAITKGLVSPVRVNPGSRPLRLDDSAGIGFRGDHWHGSFRIVRSGGSLLCVDLVGLEKYLRGVVPSEMPASWPLPALKAQAIAARSYAVATRNRSGTFDAYADTRSQVYGPIEHEASASTAAVSATSHLVVWYRHTVATTFFSSSSGGRTSSEQAAWDTTYGQPYLVPVRDRYDSAGGANPYHTWPVVTYSPVHLARALGLSGSVASVDMKIDGPSQRVLSLGVTSSGGTSTLSGDTVQVRMGLRSNYFRLLQRTLAVPAAAVAGTPFAVTGRAWPRPSHGLTLQFRSVAGAPWHVSGHALHVGAKGNFSLSLSPASDRAYRIVSAGAAVSPVVRVAVQPALALAVSGGRFHATMYPAVQGATLDLERHTSAGWPVVESATAGVHGHAVFATVPATGQWRVHFGGDATHRRGHSAALAVS
jgi:SpoIID/LytB domain protein